MTTGLIKVELEPTADTPTSMHFRDTCFEHLARFFLKMARTDKANGYHSHHTLESGQGPSVGDP
jgi:hypothetical protein